MQGKADLSPTRGIPASLAKGDVGIPVYLDVQKPLDSRDAGGSLPGEGRVCVPAHGEDWGKWALPLGTGRTEVCS